MSDNLRFFSPPNRLPIDSRAELEELFSNMWRYAIHLFGAAATAYEIDPPTIETKISVPQVLFDRPGRARAGLTVCSTEEAWMAATYELGHETVHLLGARPETRNEGTSFLEEGIATLFGSHCKEILFGSVHKSKSKQYIQAVQLTRRLGGNPLDYVRKLREEFNHLSDVSMDAILKINPRLQGTVVPIKLTSRFDPG